MTEKSGPPTSPLVVGGSWLGVTSRRYLGGLPRRIRGSDKEPLRPIRPAPLRSSRLGVDGARVLPVGVVAVGAMCRWVARDYEAVERVDQEAAVGWDCGGHRHTPRDTQDSDRRARAPTTSSHCNAVLCRVPRPSFTQREQSHARSSRPGGKRCPGFGLPHRGSRVAVPARRVSNLGTKRVLRALAGRLRGPALSTPASAHSSTAKLLARGSRPAPRCGETCSRPSSTCSAVCLSGKRGKGAGVR